MNKTKKRLKKILLYIKSIFKYISVKFLKGKKFFLFITPEHNNIGDLAILRAEEQFIRKFFPDYKLVEFSDGDVRRISFGLSSLIGSDDIVTVQGGGFLGTLWIEEEELFRKIVTQLSAHRIFVFPQTIYYGSDHFGNEQAKISKQIYDMCPGLVIFVREKKSYELTKELFPNTRVFLMPDMVLSLNYIKKVNMEKDNKILLCLRKDRERISNFRSKIIENVSTLGWNISDTDMYCLTKKYLYDKEGVIQEKLNEFANAKLVITDRLHGMVFAALAETPCIVLLSKSHKVQGVYEWISHLEYIQLVRNIDELDMAIKQVLKVETPHFSDEEYCTYYLEMAKSIKMNLI